MLHLCNLEKYLLEINNDQNVDKIIKINTFDICWNIIIDLIPYLTIILLESYSKLDFLAFSFFYFGT